MERNIESIFFYKGYQCAIISFKTDPALFLFQNECPNKYYCGYVKVPFWHPAYKVNYNNLDIQCHGGLSYSDEKLIGVNGIGWWIGFDCAHAEDTYNPKDINFVVKECKKISDQLMEM